MRYLGWLAGDLCDYNGPLLAKSFGSAVTAARFPALWRAICRSIAAEAGLRFDVVMLDKMPETVGEQANPFMALPVLPNPSGAYLTHLGAEWESFYRDTRSSSTRRRDRTKLKRLEAMGAVAFVTPEEDAGIVAALDTLFAQKRQSFAHMGVADIFARPGYQAFFRDIATDPATRGMVHVSHLDVAATLAAANFGLMWRGRYYHILASYDAGPVSRFGPGAAHLRALMQHAIERGCTVFDFTIGDEPYKREWADTELGLYDYCAAGTLRGQGVVLAGTAYLNTLRWNCHGHQSEPVPGAIPRRHPPGHLPTGTAPQSPAPPRVNLFIADDVGLAKPSKPASSTASCCRKRSARSSSPARPRCCCQWQEEAEAPLRPDLRDPRQGPMWRACGRERGYGVNPWGTHPAVAGVAAAADRRVPTPRRAARLAGRVSQRLAADPGRGPPRRPGSSGRRRYAIDSQRSPAAVRDLGRQRFAHRLFCRPRAAQRPFQQLSGPAGDPRFRSGSAAACRCSRKRLDEVVCPADRRTTSARPSPAVSAKRRWSGRSTSTGLPAGRPRVASVGGCWTSTGPWRAAARADATQPRSRRPSGLLLCGPAAAACCRPSKLSRPHRSRVHRRTVQRPVGGGPARRRPAGAGRGRQLDLLGQRGRATTTTGPLGSRQTWQAEEEVADRRRHAGRESPAGPSTGATSRQALAGASSSCWSEMTRIWPRRHRGRPDCGGYSAGSASGYGRTSVPDLPP